MSGSSQSHPTCMCGRLHECPDPLFSWKWVWEKPPARRIFEIISPACGGQHGHVREAFIKRSRVSMSVSSPGSRALLACRTRPVGLEHGRMTPVKNDLYGVDGRIELSIDKVA
eukprot:5882275-Pyramimonas_sp.AAC.2